MRLSGKLSTHIKTTTGKRLHLTGGYLRLLLFFILLNALYISGCTQGGASSPAGSTSLEANDFFTKGNYEASLGTYEKLIATNPEATDRTLFEMGIIYAHPKNDRKNYSKALECFHKIISDYPDSQYRHDSQMMIFQIQNVMIKDILITKQQKQIDAYRRGTISQENEIIALQNKIDALEQLLFELRTEPVDKILIEKKMRRLTLISKGKAIKTYTIALGGNPVGPKVMQGDKRTPEGTYTIENRNRHSKYHLSIRISYPNVYDKKRAKELGVSPGGDIMIHGIKKSLSWVGDFHTATDWTEGCIAVTNKEMEEIARLAPNGTPVEIRP